MPPVSMIPAILFCLAGIASFFCYDGLVKRELKIAKESWEKDNRPPGFFSALPGTSMMRSWTRGRLYFRWIFTTPSWIASDPIARRLQRQLRILWSTGLIFWLWALLILFHVI